MKLYGFWRSLATYRVRVAMALKGLKAEEISIDLLKGKQNTDDYLAVNPQGVVPALVLDDGGPPLVQSLAILEYLDETHPQPPLMPEDARGRARLRRGPLSAHDRGRRRRPGRCRETERPGQDQLGLQP